MLDKMTWPIRSIGFGTSLLVAASLTACAAADTSADPAQSTGDSSAIVAEATANLDTYFANNDIVFSLEDVPAAETLAGKKIMYLSAGLESPDGTAGLAALKEAQEGLDFDLTVYDGEFTLTKYQEGIRQAVAQGLDAIILYGVDCAGNQTALQEAKDAGITLVGVASVDCDEVDPSADGLFDSVLLYPSTDGEPLDTTGHYYSYGVAQADYLISKLAGDVKVIQFDVPDFASTSAEGRGFRDRMAECATCEIVETVDIRVADFGPGLQTKAEQAILKHADANAVAISYDDLVTLGIGGAIQGSGRKDELLVIAGNGIEATLDMIRDDNGLQAGFMQNYGWDHFGALDTVTRLLAGQAPVLAGSPLVIYDTDHNLPASGPFETETDFRSEFRRAWGI